MTETGTSQGGKVTESTLQSDVGFKDKYGKSIGIIFVFLIITHIPVINLVGLIPFFKEVVIAAIVVGMFTSISDTKAAAKYALISGMTAAVVFNILWIPASFFIFGALGAATGGEAAAASGVSSGMLAGLGALSNVIGLILFSPIGYSVGGVLGSLFND